ACVMFCAPNPAVKFVRLSLISPKQCDAFPHDYGKPCLTAQALRDAQAASRRANMVRIMGFKFVVAATLALSLSTFSVFQGASAAHDPQSQTAGPEQKIQQECESQNPQPVAHSYIYKGAVLWQPPADIECRDLFYGAGGRKGAPDPSTPFTYVRRQKSGTQ